MRFTLALCLLCLACERTLPPSAETTAHDEAEWFRDATAELGLDFQHDAGPIGNYFLPQIMGSGAAMLDFDNDGRFDLYFIQNGGPSGARNQLYRQRADGTFENVSAGSGLDVAGYGMGAAVGDIDNDGFVDVYVSGYGGGWLFHNRGNGTFEDVTKQAGVEIPSWGTSCSFFDYDRDGWLDLVVVNYVDYVAQRWCGPANGRQDYCHPSAFMGSSIRLFHNRGRDAAGKWLGFEDVTRAAGVAKLVPALGVVCADFNGDGWPDILVANDAQPNCLWVNQKDGTFVDEAVARGVAYDTFGNAQSNMGVALGDIDGKGRLDLAITHLTEETHTLWKQTGPGQFQDSTGSVGLAAPHWRGTGFGTVLADFDLDGALDLAVVNGRVSRTRGPPAPDAGIGSYWADYAERNQLFANDGRGNLRDDSPQNKSFCGVYAVSRGLVWGSFEGGAVDLVTTSVGGPARFFRNIAPKGGHWLIIRAVHPALKRDAYGALVSVRAGERRWIGLINPGQSYLCSGDPRAHFGLGSVDHIDEICIDWPDGLQEFFPGTGVDVTLRLERGKGRGDSR